MTNDDLKKYFEEATIDYSNGVEAGLKAEEVVKTVLNIIEENTKLKAEIEQLNWISYENLKTENDVHNRLIKEKEAEIEKLKAELEQLDEVTNLTIKETINAVRNCGEDSYCEGCFLRIGLDDCWICREELEEAEQALKGQVEY